MKFRVVISLTSLDSTDAEMFGDLLANDVHLLTLLVSSHSCYTKNKVSHLVCFDVA